MTLKEICTELSIVRSKLAEGELRAAGLEPREAAQQLTDLYYEVGRAFYLDHTAEMPRDKVEALARNLEAFRQERQLPQLDEPIAHLKNYLAQ